MGNEPKVECDSGFRSVGERSTLRVEWWQIILLFIAALSVNYGWLLTHENRITQVEGSAQYLVKTMDEVKVLVKETNHTINEIKRNGK